VLAGDLLPWVRDVMWDVTRDKRAVRDWRHENDAGRDITGGEIKDLTEDVMPT
jgi:hypothetical protein